MVLGEGCGTKTHAAGASASTNATARHAQPGKNVAESLALRVRSASSRAVMGQRCNVTAGGANRSGVNDVRRAQPVLVNVK